MGVLGLILGVLFYCIVVYAICREKRSKELRKKKLEKMEQSKSKVLQLGKVAKNEDEGINGGATMPNLRKGGQNNGSDISGSYYSYYAGRGQVDSTEPPTFV